MKVLEYKLRVAMKNHDVGTAATILKKFFRINWNDKGLSRMLAQIICAADAEPALDHSFSDGYFLSDKWSGDIYAYSTLHALFFIVPYDFNFGTMPEGMEQFRVTNTGSSFGVTNEGVDI